MDCPTESALLDPDVRERQERRNEALRQKFANPTQHIMEIGRLLTESRGDLPPGMFVSWLATVFPGCSLSSAYDYMMVSEVLAQFPHVVSVSPQTLYALARTSTPEELRHHLIRRANSDELARR